MKNSWFYVGVSIAFVCAASYIIYKRFFGADNGNAPSDPVRCNRKKHIESLSYEFIVEEAKMIVSKIESSEINSSVLSIAVTPNKLALHFFSQPNSIEWLGDIELTEEEKQKMVILSIMDTDKALFSEILIADRVMDDYYDFVPEDKIYIKKIALKK